MSVLRQWLRLAIPLSTRQALAHARRRWRDLNQGIAWSERHADDVAGSGSAYILQAELSQAIMPSALFDNKLANLAHGARRMNRSLIGPRQTWSFWRYVQEPSERMGFVVGRNLVNGQLTRQVGGGLCQLSSLIYHLGLLSGLTITERHPHSIDIYQEHERFTPLGADATVVWGFKDLRLTNPHAVEVMLECFVQEHRLIGRVYARAPLPACELDFIREQVDASHVLVHTMVNQQRYQQTLYEQKQGLALQAPS
ncbi:vancomycin resistance protein VanW [Oxalobacteraceae bacterium GrIS 1.11]